MDDAVYKDAVKKYAKGYSRLQKCLTVIPQKAWDFKPAENEWSIREIIVHLVDSETNAMLRARILAAEPGRTLMAYDQDLWVSQLAYSKSDTGLALQALKWVRKFTSAWLKTIDPSSMHTAVHPEYTDAYTFEKWLDTYANHIYTHIDQINANYGLWKQQKSHK